MATTRKLRDRWTTPAGRIAVRALENGLRVGAPVSELKGYVQNLPDVEEVGAALDLRGIELPGLVAVRTPDLSGTRFDGARLNWSFGGSDLRGARFDETEGSNVHFGGSCLADASFIEARLPGAIFLSADLQRADMRGIRMRGGQLKDADCRDATLLGADLRMVWGAGADLRGADLRQTNLLGASLGGALWDDRTRFDQARLSVEGTPAAMRASAIADGASVESEKLEWQLGLLDATREALKSELADEERGQILRRLDELRERVARDPKARWANALRDELPGHQWEAVQRAVRKAASNIGVYLDTAEPGSAG